MVRGLLLSMFIKNNREIGSSAIEFALILPMLLLILFSIIEYGWYMTNQIVLNNAVSAGTRAAIKAREWDPYYEDPEVFARAAVKKAFWISALDDEDVLITDISADEDGPRRIEVRVTSYGYRPITGYIPPDLIPGHLGAMAVMAFP